ncbi:hypothetical protein AURDEDRAFT_146367 [Auricularia subglabra TFB-10046 SS5]|nr:hypothetical protein AURDEDRAFT_146367 [Auricularia subglabra TFB-10046 SS5]
MDVPEELLAPGQAAVRPNLRLASSHGAVDADVWVVPANLGDVKGQPKTTLSFENKHGKIDIRLHALGSLPCLVNAHSTHGKVALSLPPNFVGLITTTTKHGSVEVPPQLMRLGESAGVARYFMGDQILSLSSGTWEGSAVDIKTTHGSIKVAFA